MLKFSRRQLVIAAAAMSVSACSSNGGSRRRRRRTAAPSPVQQQTNYGPIPDEPFPIPAVNFNTIKPGFGRRVVNYSTAEPAGTIIVDTDTFHLYLTMEGGRALRYDVGLGRQGFSWSGNANIESKQEWPKWFPPKEMMARQPELRKYSEKNGGHPPGLDNPLGSRALYLFENGKDTLYRLHGTAQESSIGNAVSSGCVRLMNHDIIDLYNRVPVGTKVVVINSRRTS